MVEDESKRTKKVKMNKSFYLTILDSIRISGGLPKGVLSSQGLNYYVKKLKIEGAIRNIGYGTWVIDQDKADRFLFKEQVKKVRYGGHPDVRGHGFQWVVKLPVGLSGWRGREQILVRQGFAFKRIRYGLSILFEGFTFDLFERSIVCFAPKDKSWYAESAEDSRQYALFDVTVLIGKLERLMGFNFKRKGAYKLRLSKQHYGDVDNDLAKQRAREGSLLRVSDRSGEWLLIDVSHGVPELETVHPVSASSDMDGVIKPFFNQLKETKLMPKDVLAMIAGVAEAQHEQSRIMGMYAENMASHVRVVQELGLGVRELRDAVKEKEVSEREERVKKIKRDWGW